MNEQKEINLGQLFQVLWSRVWIILLVGILFGALSLGYTKYTFVPQYSANLTVLVNSTYENNNNNLSSSQVQVAKELAKTYIVILQSRSVMGKVQEKAELPYSAGQIRGMVRAQAINETEVLSITTTCANPQHAVMIANAVAEVFPTAIQDAMPGSSVKIIDYAAGASAITPDYKRSAVMGALVGAVLCCALFVAMEILNDSITSEEYLAYVYEDVPLLAVIPDAQSTKPIYYKGRYSAHKSPAKTETAEPGGEQ